MHLWEATYCLFMFILGSGVWFIDTDGREGEEQAEDDGPPPERRMRYTRFPAKPAGAQGGADQPVTVHRRRAIPRARRS